ncbi:hypothetical protein Trydic_g21773 [Trypoxylus dichotomus]
MGKNHRHKKFLKSEKAKTKLKNSKTKFLPKGQNITDVSFKIKPIVLTEQLRTKDDEVLSSRKLNLKEILNRLTHHNINIKHDNCQQLKELILRENGEFLKQNLASILKRVCPLVLDIESKVRSEAIKVIRAILQSSSSVNVTSFFDILSSFLRCAMTHIELNIQEDSLNYLDALLDYVPELIAKDSHKILLNFFTLISKLKNDSKHARTLSENLKSRYTGIKWRIKVLLRLKKIFGTIYESNKPKTNSNDFVGKTIDVTKTRFAPIYYDKFDCAKSDTAKTNLEIENVEMYIDTLLSLLQEIWLEVAPSNITTVISGKLDNTIIKSDVACILHCLLNIFCFLFKLAEIVDSENGARLYMKFKNEACYTLLNNILSSFPFSGVSEKKFEDFGINNNVRCIEENLLVCYLFSSQYKNIRGKVIIYAEKVLHYLTHIFALFTRNKEYVRNEHINSMFLSTLKIILGKNLTCWKQAKLEMELFIESTVDYYLRNMNHNAESDLLILLYDVLDRESEKQVMLAEKSCDLLLGEKIEYKILDFLLSMVKKGVETLQNCLISKLNVILRNIKAVQVIGIDMEYVKVVRILCLYYYVPLTSQSVAILQHFGVENVEYESVIDSIVSK